ncbi:hypothetical protein KY284_020113 [Solanum tuberosum]|nr:hypothetical protein KY284_020113 [Solanum tuberosum]
MLNDVNALADGEKGRGTYVEIEKKRAMDASERELFSNKKKLVQYVSDKPISTDACVNISNTNSINASSLEFGKEKGKVILMGHNSEKGKDPVNHDKDICVGSKKKVQKTFPTHKKCLSASEFERNADCKSGHANSHIYFDSGKTTPVVVQKLKKTTPEMLFEVI